MWTTPCRTSLKCVYKYKGSPGIKRERSIAISNTSFENKGKETNNNNNNNGNNNNDNNNKKSGKETVTELQSFPIY